MNCITNFNDPKSNYQTINGVNNEFKKGEKKNFKISKKQKKKKSCFFRSPVHSFIKHMVRKLKAFNY